MSENAKPEKEGGDAKPVADSKAEEKKDESRPALISEPAKTHVEKTFKHDRPLTSCRFDPQGRYVFAGTEDYAIVRFRVSDGQITKMNGHQSWCRSFGFSHDGNTTITGGYDGQILWWPTDDEKPTPIRSVAAHQGWIRALAVSHDRKLIATCGNDHLVKLWNLEDGQPVRTYRGHDCHVYNVAFHPDGKSLVSCDLKANFKHWNLDDDKEVRTFKAAPLHFYDDKFRADIGGARSMAFSADGKWLAAGGTTNVTNAFGGILEAAAASVDWEKGEMKTLHTTKEKNRGTIWGLAWHPDGYWLGMSGGRNALLVFWKPGQAIEFATFAMNEVGRDFDLHPDGLHAAVAMAEGQIRICRLGPKAA